MSDIKNENWLHVFLRVVLSGSGRDGAIMPDAHDHLARIHVHIRNSSLDARMRSASCNIMGKGTEQVHCADLVEKAIATGTKQR